jgi:hypothetical protein
MRKVGSSTIGSAADEVVMLDLTPAEELQPHRDAFKKKGRENPAPSKCFETFGKAD